MPKLYHIVKMELLEVLLLVLKITHIIHEKAPYQIQHLKQIIQNIISSSPIWSTNLQLQFKTDIVDVPIVDTNNLGFKIKVKNMVRPLGTPAIMTTADISSNMKDYIGPDSQSFIKLANENMSLFCDFNSFSVISSGTGRRLNCPPFYEISKNVISRIVTGAKIEYF